MRSPERLLICDKIDIDVWELIHLANRHPRVNILQPGAGVGGHCIAVDPWFIVDTAPDEARIIRMAREVNDYKPEWVLEKVKAAIAETLAGKPGDCMADVKVACLGLTFKPDIDDLRESPAVEITRQIAELGCQVLAVEPNIESLPQNLALSNIVLRSLEDAIECAAVLCIMVKHRSFVESACDILCHSCKINAAGLAEE
ncbi:nucleotide sugar dehydrogenase [Desulfomicrobium apsheronum]|uniref:Nucleotide sugar dehydrogenase n=1 Tax=Desulfomicrobium apsheronum TaxID=52560 RepID=A0A1I3VTR3_9BACT|nr:UDP binding domain-containing protein [Desulfomicrobium apsheronum]SFJ97667.1 nucleotide sugar dehydrogenase [Desulfomicrobium apsheronum]